MMLTVRVAVLLVGASLVACVQVPAHMPPPPVLEPLRVTEVAVVGDPARRASMGLLLSGLDYDIGESPDRAVGSYERAIQVDPMNPWVYLVIARHRIAHSDPDGALAFLDQSESLFRASGDISPRVAVHLIGLRGRALYDVGEFDRGARLLVEASSRAPNLWRDGRLSAEELR